MGVMKTPRTGNALARIRRQAGLTQGEESALLGIRSSSPISAYERGLRLPSLSRAVEIAHILGCGVAELFPISAEDAGIIGDRAERVARQIATEGSPPKKTEAKAATLVRLALLSRRRP